MPDLPERCGALHTLVAPAITGRSIIFECERTAGHTAEHREISGTLVAIWPNATEQETP